MKVITGSESRQWYKNLDISLEGRPTGIDLIEGMLSRGTCYCIVGNDDIIDRVDVYKDGHKIHYKKFDYDNLGRVIENVMYSPDGNGAWHNVDDVWYYVYDEESGLRQKKIIMTPHATTAIEILYDLHGNRISESMIDI